MSILDILLEIKNTASTNAKKDILKSHINNEVLKKVIQIALNPALQSGIKKLPEPIYVQSKQTLDEALDALDDLYNGVYTGNRGREYLGTLFGSLTDDDAEVLRKVVSKDLDCGIQEKNANSVFGKNFIKEEPYMRCSLITKKTIKNITSFKELGYAVSEVKMDGQYLNHVIRGNSYISTSRNGKVYDFLGVHDDDMLALADAVKRIDDRFSSGVVVQGECLVIDEYGNILPRTTGNGIIQKAGKDTITEDESGRVVHVLWDILPFDAFSEGLWDVCRKERRMLLEAAIKEVNSTSLRMIEYKRVYTIDDAFDYNGEMMSRGEEGTVLKCEFGIWKSHTSPHQLKMKIEMFIDLIITGFNGGKKKRSSTLGSIQASSSDGIINVNISGFKEKDDEWTLDRIWQERDMLLGKIITVVSNEITQNKRTLKRSLFLPRYDEFRFDKDTADSFERILEIRESAIEVLRHTYDNM